MTLKTKLFSKLCVIAALMLFSSLTAEAQLLNGPDAAPAGTYEPLENDHFLGREDADATLIVYASVTCPHCANWFENTWPQLKENYIETGKLRFIFREFPTAPAQLAAAGFILANCADQDHYFDYIEYQMATQDLLTELIADESLNDAQRIDKYIDDRAKNAGLSDREKDRCLATESNFEKINQAMLQARGAGLSSVPGFILNGRKLEIEQGYYDGLSTAIDEILGQN